MHLLKQGAKPSAPRKERKKFAAAAFIPPQEEERKSPREQPVEEAAGEEVWVDEMEEVEYQDAASQAKHSKRNKSKAQPK